MDVEESAVVEKLVDREAESVAHSCNSAEGVRPGSKMRDLPQELHRVAFLLKRVARRVGLAVNDDLTGLQLHRLPRCGRFDQVATDLHTRAGGHTMQCLFG